LHHWANGK
jgi:hypothetical protein